MENIPLLESTKTSLEAAARELARAYAALETARNLVYEAADKEWPYEEDYEAPSGAKWKGPGVDALRWLGISIGRVVEEVRHGDLVDAEAFFERHLSYELEDLPF